MRRIACLCIIALAACAAEPKRPRISGTALVQDISRDVYPSPNGLYVGTLTGPLPSKDLGAPQDILLGTLTLVPVAGGKAHRIAADVPNLPGKVLYSKDSAWLAAVGGFSVAHNMGESFLAKTATGDSESIADGVSFFSFSPNGDRIAYVSGGDLFLRQTSGGEPKKIVANVSFLEVSPDGNRVLVKRLARTGGNLDLYDVAADKLTELAHGAGTFGFSPTGDRFVFRAEGLLVPGVIDIGGTAVKPGKNAAGFYRVTGNGPPKRLSLENISDFKFAPTGQRIAWVTPASGGATVGDLFVADGDEVKRAAQRVMQFELTRDGTVYLMGVYDAREQAGTLGYLPPTGPLVELSRDVRHFSISPLGKYVFYSRGVATNNSFTLALEVHRVGAPPDEKPRRIDTGVFGYSVDETEQHLSYKARCLDGGKACSLFVTDLGRVTGPVTVASRVSTFEFAPGSRGLVIVTSEHEGEMTGRLLFTLGVIAPEANAAVHVLDDQMDGDFTLAGANKDRVVYTVRERGREGLYVVDLNSPSRT